MDQRRITCRGHLRAGAVVPVLAAVAALLVATAGAQQPVPAPQRPARATSYPAPVAGDFTIKDFTFSTGETLPVLKLHYQTIGTPRRDATGVVRNAVLIMHGTGGTGRQFLSANFADVLFGPGQLLDARTHYIILPDAVGHGGSSKPSDLLHAKFPRYGYGDLVTAQYRLVTEGLQVNRLLLVMGTSMGGMHTWMWGERYPDFMDGLMPLASLPTQIAGRNRMLRKMISDDIRTDPEWNNGEYMKQPRGLVPAIHILMLMTSVPLQWQKTAPTRDAADKFLEDQVRSRLASTDANDMLYQFEASRDYDPSPDLERITAPLVAINSADDQVNPPELGLMESLIKRVRNGRYVLISISDQTRGHGTHSYPLIWQSYLKELLDRIERRDPAARPW
jgi:homoserine O-acetyltransferase